MTASNIGIFQSEIKSMMYAFGDIRSPSSETALLIEDITLKQIQDLVKQAYEITNLRGGKFISLTDVFFLMRRNKSMLKRAVKHVELKDTVKRANSQSKSDDEDPIPDYESVIANETKRKKYSLDFLSESEQEEILSDEVDESQQRRLEKLDSVTKDMDVLEYKEFTESRRVNFQKNTTKLKEWLDISSLVPSYKPSQRVIEMLGYLAYETVQEIVELALLVKQDQEQKLCDPTGAPLSWSPPPSEFGTTPTFFTTPVLNNPVNISPPSSPKSPSGTSLSSPTQIISKPKTRKRGRPPKMSVSESVTPSSPPTAIQPSHIHEALRRYTTFSIGPLAPLKTYFSKPSLITRTFCT